MDEMSGRFREMGGEVKAKCYGPRSGKDASRLTSTAVLSSEPHFERCSGSVKGFYLGADKSHPWNRKSRDAATYYKEFSSDATLAVFLAFLDLYKIANATLRSSIENYLRFFLLANGGSLSGIKYTPSLFAKMLKLKRADSSKDCRTMIGRLRTLYGSLSEHVHTASMNHVSLHENLASLPVLVKERFKSTVTTAQKICKTACELNLIALGSPEGKAQHNLTDFLLDQYSRRLKREYAQ